MAGRRSVVAVAACLALVGVVGPLHGAATVGFGTDRVTLEQGTRTQVDVVISEADDGVGSYRLSVATNNTSVVAIEDVEVAGTPSEVNATVSDAGGTVDVTASGLQLGGPSTRVVTVTLAARAPGTTALQLSATSIGTTDDTPYIVSTPDRTAAVTVTGSGVTTPPRVSTSPPPGATASGEDDGLDLPLVLLGGGLLALSLLGVAGYRYAVE